MSVGVRDATPTRRRRADISLRGAFRYWHRNTVVFRRIWVLGIMVWFAEPVIYLFAMGVGLGAYLQEIRGVEYMEFIAPGLLAVSAMWGATFESTWNTYTKIRDGVYDAASSTPLSITDVAVGEIAWATTRATIYGTAFAVVATAFGVFRSWWGLLVIPGVVLVGFVFSITGLVYTYAIRRIDYLAYYWTLFLTPMFMFAGVFFPLDRLPGWVQIAAWFMPLHHGANLMRSLALEGDPAAAIGPFLWLVVVGAGSCWVPVVLLRRRMAR